MLYYLTDLRVLYIVNDLETSAFKDERLPLFLKSLKFQAPFNPKQVLTLDIDMLQRIICQCDKSPFPVVFKPVYLVVFSLLWGHPTCYPIL